MKIKKGTLKSLLIKLFVILIVLTMILTGFYAIFQ